jgi:hypothetical protein
VVTDRYCWLCVIGYEQSLILANLTLVTEFYLMFNTAPCGEPSRGALNIRQTPVNLDSSVC